MAFRIEHWLGQSLFDLAADRHYQRFFSLETIERIGDQNYLTSESHGLDMVLNDALRIEAIHLQAPTLEQAGYQGMLPLAIAFTHTRADVHQLMDAKGIAGETGGGEL